jgi:hypothetical protein
LSFIFFLLFRHGRSESRTESRNLAPQRRGPPQGPRYNLEDLAGLGFEINYIETNYGAPDSPAKKRRPRTDRCLTKRIKDPPGFVAIMKHDDVWLSKSRSCTSLVIPNANPNKGGRDEKTDP